MKLQLEFTHVDHANHRVTLKPINCALKGDLIYDLPQRAAALCHIGDVVEASIPLPDQYPINDGTNYYLSNPLRPGDLETKKIDGKWYKHQRSYPHNWEPIQIEIDKAIHQSRCDGLPHVIPQCGYVSHCGEFIPYKLAKECAA